MSRFVAWLREKPAHLFLVLVVLGAPNPVMQFIDPGGWRFTVILTTTAVLAAALVIIYLRGGA